MGEAEYTQVTASDVHRDGLGVELWKQDEMIAEIFRSDRDRLTTITLWKQDLPLDLIEGFIADANQKLGDYVTDNFSS